MTTQTARPTNWIGYSDMRCDDPRGQFYNWNTTRAMIVRGDGGQRRELAPGLIDRPDTWTQFAGWSPDGRQAIVLRCWEDEANYIWERANKTFRHTQGWLVDSCLIDMQTGRVEIPTAIDRVSTYNAGMFFWPNDPDRLGFTALIDGESRPFSMKLDGSDKRDLSTGESGFTYGYSASPDGRRITYHKNYQVFLADADGSNAKRIDTGDSFHFCPTWSPDGRWLTFLAGDHYKCDPHLVAADGSGLRKLADRGPYRGVVEVLDTPDFHSESSDVPVWSADSRWVYFTAVVGDAVELMRVSLEGKAEQLTRSRPGARPGAHPGAGVLHYHPQGSPDAQWVVFGSTCDGARALYVARVDGSDVQPITQAKPGRAQMHARWGPVA